MKSSEVKLKDLLSVPIQNGYSPICPEEPNGFWILGLNALSENGIDINGKKPAPLNDKRVKQFLLKSGDFLMSRSNTPDKVGRSILYRGEIENCSYPDLMMKFRVNENKIFPEYLEFYLKSPKAMKYLRASASGTSASMVKINKTVVEKIPVYLPSYDQQKKIATIGQEIIHAIETTERLIAAKERYFDGLAKQLFDSSQSNAWQKVKLKDVAKILEKTKLQSLDNETLLTVKLHCQGIERNTRIVPTLTEKGRPYYKRFEGEFLIGRQNFHNGGFGIVPKELDGLIASNAITSIETNSNKLYPDYLFWYFSRKSYYKKVGHTMDGTGQKELSDKQILKLEIRLPILEKQIKIAELLNTAKCEIDLLKKLAESYRLQKRGLMQKLLSGEWHVDRQKAS